MKYLKIVSVVFIGLMFVVAGCGQQGGKASESNLTVGMAKKFIYPKKTNQAEVLEIFGPPDLVTRKEGKEVWTYDKIANEVVSSSGYLTIILAGYSKNRSRSSSISTMLIIYFDKNDVVEDYAMSVSKF